MQGRHIAFCLEHAYGHVLPTVGMAAELLKSGHRVSYAVTASFAAAIARIGAVPVTIRPTETRAQICRAAQLPGGAYDFTKKLDLHEKLREERTADAVQQLEEAYRNDRPDLIVHDHCLDYSGRQLAINWQIPRVCHVPHLLQTEDRSLYAEESIILVSVPRFFHERLETFDARFRFVGFNPNGRQEFFTPWTPESTGCRGTILISATTGLLPPLEFCRLAIGAFRFETDFNVVLSIPSTLDPFSHVNTTLLGEIPRHFRVNTSSSNLEILEHCCLFIGQGGLGSTLESVYRGVPQIVIPAASFHEITAARVAALGLGVHLPISDASGSNIRGIARRLILDENTRRNVQAARRDMQSSLAEYSAPRILLDYISSN